MTKEWNDIHEDFAEEDFWINQTYQQKWEEKGLTYHDAKEWISVGLTPKNCELVVYYRSKNFSPTNFANQQVELKAEYENWKETSKDCQEYLTLIYPQPIRVKVTYLDISSKNLTGTLDCSEFVNLEKLDCPHNKITKLTLPKDCSNLKELSLSRNNFYQDLSFLKEAINLEVIWLENNSFAGSLKPLQNLTKLKKLSISNTDINSGIEHLPEGLEEIYYSIKDKPNCKLTKIVSQLEVYTWRDVHPKFTPELRKIWEDLGFNREQVKNWIEAGIEIDEYKYDYKFVSYLRDVKKLTPEWLFINKEASECQELRKNCDYFDWCRQCQQINTSPNWCQPCREKEWQKDLKKLTGKELVEKFIQQKPTPSIMYEFKMNTIRTVYGYWIPCRGWF